MSGKREEVKNPFTVGEYAKLVVKLSLWFGWSLVWGTAGIVLCVSVFGIGLGLGCFAIAAAPLNRMIKRRNAMVVRWEMKEATHTGKAPWEEGE